MAEHSGDMRAANFWISIGNLIFGFIRLGAVLVLTTSPVIVMCLGIENPLRSFAFFLAMLFLCSPGITAAFATFRDCPDLGYSPLRRSGEADAAIAAGYVAAPRWSPEEEHRIFRPYFRVYFKLAPRSFVMSAVVLAITLILLYDWVWLARVPSMPGAFASMFLVLALVTLSIWFTTLTMVVEFPQARWWAILRNSFYLSIRKWYMSLLNLLVLGTWIVGIMYAPILMPVFGTPLVLHLVWANCRWITMPLIKELDGEAQTEQRFAKLQESVNA